jgi:type I restriction enzyme, S subunit
MAGDRPDSPRPPWAEDFPSEWKLIPLGEMFVIQQGKALGPKSRQGRSAYPFLRTSNILWHDVDLGALDQMNFTDEERAKLRLAPDDLLVCEGGDVGRTAIWRGQLEECYHQNHVHRLRLRNHTALPEFYAYWMEAAFTQFNAYAGQGNVTTIPNLSKGRLGSFLVPVPPLPEQREIVRVLTTVREAIRATDRVIEASRELIASLMSNFFDRSGWPTTTLGSACDLLMGQSPPSRFYNDLGEGLPFLQGKTEFSAKFPKATKYCAVSPKVAPAGSVLMSVRAPVGDVNLADQEYVIGRGIAALVNRHGSSEYLYYVLKHFKGKIESLGTGTTFDSVNKGTLQQFELPMPGTGDQNRVSSALSVVDTKISREQERLWVLTELYRTLLQHLMSGEHRLPARELAVNA